MDIIAAIDQEIERLTQARDALSDVVKLQVHSAPAKPVKSRVKAAKRRLLSPEARAKIAAAQKKRWAATKKTKG